MNKNIVRCGGLLLALILVFGLAACGGSGSQSTEAGKEDPTTAQSTAAVQSTEAEKTTEAAEKTTEAETTPTTAEQTPAETQAPEIDPNLPAERVAILTAAKAAAGTDELARVKAAFAAAGADLAGVDKAFDLMTSPLLTLLPGIAQEAPESLTVMFDWMTKEWDGGYAKLDSDLITPEKKAERLALYNNITGTAKIIKDFNTPQQILRAYAQAQPGDLLLSSAKGETKTRLARIIARVEVSFLADGVSVDPAASRFMLVVDGAEEELTFQNAYVKYFALPYQLSSLDGAELKTPEPAQAKLPEKPVLKVGFGRADITSDLSIPLAGYGNTTSRMSKKTLTAEDRLMATAIAISDGTDTEIIYTMDTIRIPALWTNNVAAALEKATGIGAEHVAFSSTHTHSGPDIGENLAITARDPYYQVWEAAVIQAGLDAVADLAEVSETKAAVVTAEDLNYTRHWRSNDGRMEGINFSSNKNFGSAEVADEDMQLIRFVRADRKDVVLVNWQGHNNAASTANTTYGTTNRPFISADYAGFLRRYLEKQDEDIAAAYFLGASGNVLPRASEEGQKKYNVDECDKLGELLACYALAAMENMTVVETGAVQGRQVQHLAFDSGYVGTIREIEQNVISVGKGIAFVTAGYEMFNVNGEAVKERSPFAVTFVCTCAQDHAYMPSFQAHHYGILDDAQVTPYELSGTHCKVVSGTAEDLVDGLVGMLDQQWANLGLTEADIDKSLTEEPQQITRVEAYNFGKAGNEPINLAQGAILSYTYSRITSSKYDPALLIDGDHDPTLTKAAGWCYKDNGEIMLDLGKIYSLTGYRLENYTSPTIYGGIKGWILMASADGTNWTTLDTVEDNSGEYRKLDFPEAVEARYVKIVATDAWENTKLAATVEEKRMIRLSEWEVYGIEKE